MRRTLTAENVGRVPALDDYQPATMGSATREASATGARCRWPPGICVDPGHRWPTSPDYTGAAFAVLDELFSRQRLPRWIGQGSPPTTLPIGR